MRVRVYDARGRLVSVLVDEVQSAGEHTVTWKGDARSDPLPSGVYFLRLDQGGQTKVGRVVLF